MASKLLLSGVAILVVFFGYVFTRKSQFYYERSVVIQASADKIYPYLSDFKKGIQWNPYDQKDPEMKRTFRGPDAQVGSMMEFNGNRKTGVGKLEILKLVPNQSVEIKLTMTQPMKSESLVRYRLAPEGNGTRFMWSMEGDGGLLGKLVGVFMDCEKFVAGDLEKGVAQLKAVAEAN